MDYSQTSSVNFSYSTKKLHLILNDPPYRHGIDADMSERLKGKIAIVTGASSGIGRAIAVTFAKHGATIVCSDLQEVSRATEGAEAGVSTHDVIMQHGGVATFLRADVQQAADMESLVKTAVEKFGRLDM